MSYFGLSTEELNKLSEVSGEAVRLYLAVSSYCFGSKTFAYPLWWQLAERMGKPFIIDPEKVYGDKSPLKGQLVPVQTQRSNQKRPLQKLAIQLEKSGLIKRGSFGKGGEERWTLIYKAQLISARQETSKEDAPDVNNDRPSNDQKERPPRPKETPFNKKHNKKHNNKHNKRKIDNKTEEKDTDSYFKWKGIFYEGEKQGSVPKWESRTKNWKLQVTNLMFAFTADDWELYDLGKDFILLMCENHSDTETINFLAKCERN